jgi:hypothetical protein
VKQFFRRLLIDPIVFVATCVALVFLVCVVFFAVLAAALFQAIDTPPRRRA